MGCKESDERDLQIEREHLDVEPQVVRCHTLIAQCHFFGWDIRASIKKEAELCVKNHPIICEDRNCINNLGAEFPLAIICLLRRNVFFNIATAIVCCVLLWRCKKRCLVLKSIWIKLSKSNYRSVFNLCSFTIFSLICLVSLVRLYTCRQVKPMG